MRLKDEAAQLAANPVPLNRAQCLEFAVGSIAKVLGQRFAEVDTFTSRVRLPNEPLMFVDRVLALEGKSCSMGPGRIVTEHDIHPGAWYLDRGHIPAGLAIESGQADLMLAAWLGVDFITQGQSLYRLLDAEVTFHRGLPQVGETAHYDIRIIRFFKYGQTHLFRFEFEGTINGKPLLTMKNGCAGFFTKAELAGGRGLPGGGLLDDAPPVQLNPKALAFRSSLPKSLDKKALESLRVGNLSQALGADFTPQLKNPLKLPGDRLSLIHRITRLEKNGGRYGAGFIRAEVDIDPQAWFLTSHFLGDEVMPGTLMYDSCLHALRVFLTALGWVGEEQETSWQPILGRAASLKCRGQVTGETKVAAYEIHIRRLDFQVGPSGGPAEPIAEAEAIMLADNRPIVEVRNLNVRLAGSSYEQLGATWSQSQRQEAGSVVTAKNDYVFKKKKIMELAQGRPSAALGKAYARFDNGAFVARLPRTPYDFVDKVTVTQGQPYEVKEGSEVIAKISLGSKNWVFDQAGGHKPSLPYAALNEIALQPCGFLAAFMGSALPFEGPRYFRNLGGEATVVKEVRPRDIVDTKATLTRASRMGDMVIQHYRFLCQVAGETVYEGVTHFGFFSPEALAVQAGLTGESFGAHQTEILSPYPEGTMWPQGLWRMVDNLTVDVQGGVNSLGSVLATTEVNPDAWFFKAHFYQDPVWPGSLGLEAFIQSLKALAVARFGEKSVAWHWGAPVPGHAHQWLYRGQITPDHKKMTVALEAREVDDANRTITADGLLLVDGKPIYKMTGFTVGMGASKLSKVQPTAPPVVAAPPTPASIPSEQNPITANMLMSFRKENGLSQGQLATLMGVTPIYISLMERGKRNISPLMAEKLTLIFTQSLGTLGTTQHESQLLSKGSLKSRREEKEAAYNIMPPAKLRELRIARGLSQKKLADQVGVTATLIGLIELDKRSLSLDLARKIQAVIGD